MTNVMSYTLGYAAAMKCARRANATSDLYAYVTLAREIDRQRIALDPDVARLLSNRLSRAETTASALLGLRWVGRVEQRSQLRELMVESRTLRSRLGSLRGGDP